MSFTRKHPLVAVVAAYGLGVLPAQWFHPGLAFLFGGLAVLLAGMLIFRKVRGILLWPLLLAAGWTNFAVRTAVVSPADLRVLLGGEPAVATVRGVLAETPRLKISERDGREKWRSVARVRVGELRREGDFQPAAGEVVVSTPAVLGPEYFAGQRVEVAGVAAQPPLPVAEGLFDFRDYLETRGIYYQVRVESTNDWKILEPRRGKAPLTDRFLNWSRGTLALGLPAEDEPLRLLWAMTLGWRTAFTGDISEPYLRAGTMHLFAIDGLRIALVSGMLVMLFRMLRLPRAGCGALAIPLFWFYTAATGWEPSAMRASVMMTIVIGGWMARRPVDLLNSLAAAAIIILVADPRQLLEAGFQLSFFVVLVIGVLLPPVNEFSDALIARWLAPDPLLPAELVPGWRKTGVVWARRLAHFCGLSFVAWVGAAPLAAKYFHLFSPVSTPANMVAVPLGAFALMANLGSLLCGHWLPWCTELFNHAAWFFMSAMTWVSVEAARLPGAYCYVAEPSLATVALYYGVIIAAFSGWFRTRRRKLASAAVLLVIAAGYGWHWQAARGETHLTVLPLGGGHAVYVAGGGRDNECLINCGSEDAVSFTLKDYLRGQGVNSLPRLVLADGSARNFGGAGLADDLFGVGGLWTSGVQFRSAAYRDAVARFEAGEGAPGGRGQGSRHHILHWGDTNGCWRVLFPAATENVSRAGDAALVLRGDFHGTRILLLSDLSRAGQSELLAQTNDLRAEIAIAGLPDEGEPVCDALLAAVRPQVVVIADAELPAGRRAGRPLRERLDRAKLPVLYTRTAGAVTIITDRSGWRLRTMDGRVLAGSKTN